MADEKSAVYVSWQTFRSAIEHLADGVPTPIDRSTFPTLSGGVQNQLFAALKFLGLISDDSIPTDDLHALAVPDENERKKQLETILRHRYAALFDLNLEKTTPNALSAKMSEAYSVSGDTKEKAVRFFLLAVTYVGIPISRLFKVPGAATSGNSSTRVKKRATTRQKPPVQPRDETPSVTGTSREVELESGGKLTISATLDIFLLSPEDRSFVFELIDKLAKYEKEHQTQNLGA